MNKNLLLGATPLVVVAIALLVFAFSEEHPSDKLAATSLDGYDSRAQMLEGVIQSEPTPVPFADQSSPKRGATVIAGPVHASPADSLDEERAMAKLRRLLGHEPDAAIKLAQELDLLFPSGEQAPERHWVIVKSLTDMGDFEAARQKAVLMVEEYGDTTWGRDVKRHVLTHPAGAAERNE